MPRTKLDKNNGKYRKLTVLINGAARADNKNAVAVGRVIGMSECSGRKYLDSPEKLSLENLLKLARNLNIPISDLRDAIQY